MFIACATDRTYLELAGVMLRSLVVNGEVATAELVVCSDGLLPEDKDALRACTGGRPLTIVDLYRSALPVHGTPGSWPLTTLARLVLPDRLMGSGRPLLFLDCDTLVLASLRPLFAHNLGGAIVAAAPLTDADLVREANHRLGRAAAAPYFSAGVLLVSVDRWRRQGIARQAFSWAAANPGRIVRPDQDAVNVVMADAISALPNRWNWQSQDTDFSAASILHFVGRKPNMASCPHPARQEYLRLRAETPWAGKPLISEPRRLARSLARRVGGLLRPFLPDT